MTPTDERRADAIADLEAEIARIEGEIAATEAAAGDDCPPDFRAYLLKDRALMARQLADAVSERERLLEVAA